MKNWILLITFISTTAFAMDSIGLSSMIEKTAGSQNVCIVSFLHESLCHESASPTGVVSLSATLLVPIKGFAESERLSVIKIRFPDFIDECSLSQELEKGIKTSGRVEDNSDAPFVGPAFSFVGFDEWPEQSAFPYLVFLDRLDSNTYNFMTGFKLDCFLGTDLEQNLRRDPFYILDAEVLDASHPEVRRIPASFDFGERTELERLVPTATLENDGDRTAPVTDLARTDDSKAKPVNGRSGEQQPPPNPEAAP